MTSSPLATRFKLFSDPVHGFINVPRNVLVRLIQSPEVQRLRRIRQLGVGYMVFPGAEHSRFGHALGAMALMHDALASIAEKGTPVSKGELTASMAAALLHDIGHGPFSHTLENELIRDFHHETMSRALFKRLGDRFDGDLDLALQIFDGNYERRFYHQLVTSQLDMDRLDYLRRDSFYTGVTEGSVGVDRIIKTLRVHPVDGGTDSRLVVESKGIYAVESYLIARRLMYWQVYLHKTVIAGDRLLRSVLRRVRMKLSANPSIAEAASPAFLFFLKNDIASADVHRDDVCDWYTELDDADVLYSLKQWARSDDRILADLCRRFMTRRFFRVTFLQKPPDPEAMGRWRASVADWLVSQRLSTPSESDYDASFYLGMDYLRHAGYESMEDDSIFVLDNDGRVRELTETAATSTVASLTEFEVKPYVCFPKEIGLEIQ